MEKIRLHHGDGGVHTSKLIKEIIYKHFDNEILLQGMDSSVFSVSEGRMAYTTDSFVVKPLFFSGGDIGKLAVFGTVNDLSVVGANPMFLTSSFIIEEGLEIEIFERIVKSMAEACIKADVKIVTGDTKVVEKGSADKIFINTAGIGIVNKFYTKPIEVGDKIIISGTIAEHGTAIAIDRYNIGVKGDIKSDCYPLNKLIGEISKYFDWIKFMRDPTRGGLATVLNEISEISGLGIEIIEENIPIRREVRSVNEILGLDPLYLASEGRVVLIVKEDKASDILNEMRKFENCKKARIIGTIVDECEPIVYMKTIIGGKRILNPLESSMLPRIC